MKRFHKTLQGIKKGSLLSIRVKDSLEPMNGKFEDITHEGVICLKTMVFGSKKHVAQTYNDVSGAFGGYVPDRTYLHVEDIKQITILEKYAKKESKDKRQETDEDSQDTE